MRFDSVENRTRNRPLATRAVVADRWWPRLRGLLGRPRLQAGEGLLLVPCTSVHTIGMRYPIDVAFLDPSGRVVAVYPELPPRRATRLHREAASALELPAGTLAQTETVVGDTLRRNGAPGMR